MNLAAARRRCFRPQVELLEDRQLPALVITPTFDATINNDPKAATIKSTINAAIATLQSSIADSLTVKITFKEVTTGLSSNTTQFTAVSYSSYRAALASHAHSADDTSALATLPSTSGNPVNGGTLINMSSANARVLGLMTTAPASDATVSINTSVCNLSRSGTQDPTKYDLETITWHEMDEVLGMGSALDGLTNGAAAPSTIEPDDLYRFDQNGARSFNTTLSTQAFYAIDGGKTRLARFNQTQGADFGDWYSPGTQTPAVQDANGTPGTAANLGVEIRRLDVLGYTRINNAVPVVTAPANQIDAAGSATTITLGSFTGTIGPWMVDVKWGDGSADTTFNISAAGSLGTQSHTFAAGYYKVIVTVTDSNSHSGSATFAVADSTTSISLDASKNLVVQDAATGGKADAITVQADTANSRYVFVDTSSFSAFGIIGTITGASVSTDKHTAFVPFAAVTGPQISLNTMAGNDSVVIDLSLGALPKPVKIDGGAGTNTLTGPNTATTWSITAANAGTLTGGLAFKNVQNLTGGSARDVFRFATGGALGGKISGGSGTNWLDFSPLTTSVVVNLAGGSATHVAGGVSGINNVLGSAVGGDKITGSSAGGILVTHAGHNTVNAGGGRSILIGGMGVNHLNGGASDDLIINGRTLYDGNVATLEAILTVWQNAQTYAQRIAALQAAGSTQLKIGNTVFLSTGISNGTGPRLGTGVFVYESTLRGNGGSDWFFTKSLVTVLDRATGEVVTSS